MCYRVVECLSCYHDTPQPQVANEEGDLWILRVGGNALNKQEGDEG